LVIFTRSAFLAGSAILLTLAVAQPASAQDLQDRPTAPPPASEAPLPTDPDQVQFSSTTLEYDQDTDTVTATGDVRMYRQGDKLRADTVVWNRKTGQVVANGNIAVTNPQGDVAYGDKIELTDSLKDGVVDNMLVVLQQGGRLAAVKGQRDTAHGFLHPLRCHRFEQLPEKPVVEDHGREGRLSSRSSADLLYRRALQSVRVCQHSAAEIVESGRRRRR
jgi:hypothetical protein